MKNSFSRFFGLTETKELADNQETTDQEIEEAAVLEQDLQQENVHQISIDNIVPNRFQPRTIFNESKIEELARTIHTHGIIQPIVVREYEGGKFEIIAGERRWRATKYLGWDKIPAIVKQFNDKETASVALIENLQREELTPIEEAIAYSKLIELHELTQEALAQRLGKGQSTVANKLRLLKLPEEVQQSLLNKEITERHARAIIPLNDSDKQLKLLKEIVTNSLNVKQTEEKVAKLLTEQTKKKKPRRKGISKDIRIALNTIRHSLTMVNDTGITLESEEEDFEDYYQFTIKIPKNK